MTHPDPAAALAHHVVESRFDSLSASTIDATKRDLMDTFACALGGSGAPGIAQLLRLFRRWGGTPEAGLILSDQRFPAPQAAFIHGAIAHALDFDDTYDRGCSIHPGASVLGAILATLDMIEGASGADVILAAALGLDVSCRIALAAHLDRGWHRTSAIGVFGATAAAGKLLDLDANQMHHAFGIALSQAAGSRQCIIDGALTKRFQAGQAASAGIVSAMLAADGFTGAIDVFSGRFGFYELYQPNGYTLGPLTAELGTIWRGDEVSFKPYPCGRPQHAAIDVAIALHTSLAIRQVSDIESVTVTAEPALLSGYFEGAAHKRRPTQIVEAQFAFPFLIAVGLLRGKVGIDEVANFHDPDVLSLAQRIEARAGQGPLTMTVHRVDGGHATQAVGIPLGAPENPLPPAQLLAKFHDCAAHTVHVIEPATLERTLSTLTDLQTLPDARVILQALTN